MADRFAYLPLMGLFVMLVWLVSDLMSAWPNRVTVQSVLAIAVLGACLAATHRQLRYWRDSESLWTHALAVTSANYLAQNNLGKALLEKGEVADATSHFQAARNH